MAKLVPEGREVGVENGTKRRNDDLDISNQMCLRSARVMNENCR